MPSTNFVRPERGRHRPHRRVFCGVTRPGNSCRLSSLGRPRSKPFRPRSDGCRNVEAVVSIRFTPTKWLRSVNFAKTFSLTRKYCKIKSCSFQVPAQVQNAPAFPEYLIGLQNFKEPAFGKRPHCDCTTDCQLCYL